MKSFIDSHVFAFLWLTGFGGGAFCQWLHQNDHSGWVLVMIGACTCYVLASIWVLPRLIPGRSS